MNIPGRQISRRDAIRIASGAGFGIALGRFARADATPASPTERITLENPKVRVAIDPENGCGLLSLAVKKDDRWLDLSPNDRMQPGQKQCSWLMAPYSNRIENGVFRFEGREYKLRNGASHAIHGDARTRPWKIESQRSDFLHCSLRTSDFTDFNWPWPMELRLEFALEENVFTQRLSMRNLGTSTMPAGFGWHPYYLRTITQPDEPVLMQMNCAGVYPDTNGNCIPSGPAAKPAPDFDFSKATAIPRDRKYDHCFSGYDGKGAIKWPKSGVKIQYDCSPNVTHLVFYSPPDKPWFAVEPAANANNGVNLLDRGDATNGVIPLPAGEELKARFAIQVSA